MSQGIGSSVIPVAVFLAILLFVLPVSADNVTTSQTTVPTTLNTIPQTETTIATTVTTSPPTETTIATTVTTSPPTQTTVATTQTTATPTKTTVAVTTLPTTVITTANPTLSSAPTPATGSVSVYSSPTGASILIDGVYSGTTPDTVNGMSEGNHILRLALSGYYDYEGSIYIIAGQTAEGYGTLQPMNQATFTTATPAMVIPVIVPVVTPTPEPTQDPGLLGNSTVIAAIIGSITVLIASAATIFTHVTPPPNPPKKE